MVKSKIVEEYNVGYFVIYNIIRKAFIFLKKRKREIVRFFFFYWQRAYMLTDFNMETGNLIFHKSYNVFTIFTKASKRLWEFLL